MTAVVGGGLISFAQLVPEPAGASVTYEGRVAVPSGASILDVYWYTRGDWDTSAELDVGAEEGVITSVGIATELLTAEPVGAVDTAASFHQAGNPGANDVIVVSNVTQDFVFTVTETVSPGAARVGLTLAGVVFITPSVAVSDPGVVVP